MTRPPDWASFGSRRAQVIEAHLRIQGTQPVTAHVVPGASAGFRDEAADEPCCTPGPVSGGPRGPPGGGHPSRVAVTDDLQRSTRGLGRAALEHPRSAASTFPRGRRRLLTLLRVGFTEPAGSPRPLVVSYTTVSPLPGASRPRRSVFCGTVPWVAPGRRYLPPCPVEPGRSSAEPEGPDATARTTRLPYGHGTRVIRSVRTCPGRKKGVRVEGRACRRDTSELRDSPLPSARHAE